MNDVRQMRVALIGGTGFVGAHLVDAMLDAGHKPVLLARNGSTEKVPRPERVEVVEGSIDNVSDLLKLMKGCDALVYCVGILRESPLRGATFEALQYQGLVRSIEAADASGVSRVLLMSANGARTGGTPYQDTKYRAERAVLDGTIPGTVFRPSVIFGDPRGHMELATQLYRDMIATWRPALEFYSASGVDRGPVVMSPVHVDDVADAFVAALSSDDLIGKTVTLGGPEDLSWRQMLQRIGDAVGRSKRMIRVPIEVMRLAALFLDWLPTFPVTRDQLTMLAEGNTADPSELRAILGRSPRAFTADHLSYLA